MILAVMGVAGSGKSTLGRALAQALGWAFIEADEFHSADNVAKMRRGLALDDTDRAPWLGELNRRLKRLDEQGKSAVMACSALKAGYRERLSQGIADLRFVYLSGSATLIRDRLQARKGHFMPPELLDSQLATLEPPDSAMLVSADSTTEQQVASILSRLDLEQQS